MTAPAHPRTIARTAMVFFWRLAALAALAAAASGCTIGGYTSAERESERLRLEARGLNDRIAALTAERDELAAKLAGSFTTPEAAAAAGAIPLAVNLEIDDLSGLTPPGSEGPATGVVLYITPRDGRNRFVQVVGSLRIEVVWRAADGRSSPLASATLGPEAIRDRYREGLGGTHYTIELPLPSPISRPLAPKGTISLVATLSDAATGKDLTATRDLQ